MLAGSAFTTKAFKLSSACINVGSRTKSSALFPVAPAVEAAPVAPFAVAPARTVVEHFPVLAAPTDEHRSPLHCHLLLCKGAAGCPWLPVAGSLHAGPANGTCTFAAPWEHFAVAFGAARWGLERIAPRVTSVHP